MVSTTDLVERSNRYISDRFLPDKAIDLMEEYLKKPRQVLWTPEYKPYANKPEFKSQFKTQKRLEALGSIDGAAYGDGTFFNTFADTHNKQ